MQKAVQKAELQMPKEQQQSVQLPQLLLLLQPLLLHIPEDYPLPEQEQLHRILLHLRILLVLREQQLHLQSLPALQELLLPVLLL